MTLANNAEQLNVGVSLLLQLGTGNWGNWELGAGSWELGAFMSMKSAQLLNLLPVCFRFGFH